MSPVKVGCNVEVLRDIFRYPSNTTNRQLATNVQPITEEEFIHDHHNYWHKLYATKGDIGVVEEIFNEKQHSYDKYKTIYAKVRMSDGSLKTFRITSLKRIN